MAFGSEGEAFIDVHANTDPYERELERKIKASSKDAEKILDEVGESWGEHLADSTSKELGKHGDDFGRAMERSVRGKTVHIDGVRYVFDRRGRLHDAAGRFVRMFEQEVEKEVARAAGPGGPLDRIGQGFADAVGASFNISGRSPLIALLVPLVASIVALVVAAIQALNSLIALAATLPALLASIGVQVGVLFIAFQGMGTAISGAFAAKNVTELNKALQGLTPSAQNFVRALLPLKQLFTDIKTLVQESFFRALGTGPIADLIKNLRPILTHGLSDVALALGFFFRELAQFFNSPIFIQFVKDIFPATIAWIQIAGPALIHLLRVFVALADLALPFLEKFGMMFANALISLSNFIANRLNSGKARQWLDSMEKTLESVFELLGQVTEFIVILLAQLDEAGGKKLIDELVRFFMIMNAFLSSPAGQKALEGLIDLLIFSIQVVGGLVLVILGLLALLEVMGEAVHAFFSFLIDIVGPAIGDWFVSILEKVGSVGQGIIDFFRGLYTPVQTTFINLRDTISARLNEAIAFVRGLPERAQQALVNLGKTLFQAGRNLVQGFIDGIKSMVAPLLSAGGWIVSQVARFMPGSPAEEGPFSGSGYTLYRGQRMVQDLIRGIKMEAPELREVSTDAMSQINFGRGAIQVNGNFDTEQQATRTGTAVGNGINAMLAAQQTRLAVRTL